VDNNLTSPKTVKAIMRQYSISPLKRFGQDFLIDGNIADKIAVAAVTEGCIALEIGPGLGALTERLVKRARRVTAYEIDAGLVRVLGDMFKDTDNLTVIHKDFLKADLSKDIKDISGCGIYVAANLPYYITTECLMKLVESDLNIRKITVMVQKEFAQKVCAAAGSGQYGAISAIMNYFSSPEILFSVPPSCFYPSPKVFSSVLALNMRDIGRDMKKEYLTVVKSLFAMRRKTVKSNLRQAFKLSMQEAETILQKSNIDPNARAETLSVTDFINLSGNLKNQ